MAIFWGFSKIGKRGEVTKNNIYGELPKKGSLAKNREEDDFEVEFDTLMHTNSNLDLDFYAEY